MGKLIGYDGKEYDNPLEWSKANERWEREEAQKKSLERQEELIEKQNELIEEQAVEQRRIAEEQMENDRWIEIERQEHEKEMRLLSLCDEIGISKNIIDKYIMNLTNADELMSKNKKIIEIENKLCDIDNNIYKIYGNFVKKNNEEIDVIVNMKKKYTLIITISFYVFLFLSSLIVVNVFLGLLVIITSIVSFSIFIKKYIELNKNCKTIHLINYVYDLKTIEMKRDEIDHFESFHKDIVSSLDKDNINLANYKSQKKELLEEKNQVIECEINNRLNDFYNFRLDHYNSGFEKFLVDFDFENKIKRGFDQIDIDYKTVTKSLAAGKGDIEDYIEYFSKQ